jgi:hypothetical protein
MTGLSLIVLGSVGNRFSIPMYKNKVLVSQFIEEMPATLISKGVAKHAHESFYSCTILNTKFEANHKYLEDNDLGSRFATELSAVIETAINCNPSLLVHSVEN